MAVEASSYVPVTSGLFETPTSQDVYACVVYADFATKSVKAMVYIFDGRELYDRPISGFVIWMPEKFVKPKHRTFAQLVNAICRSFASGGLSVHGSRDAEYQYYDLFRGKYYGSNFIYRGG